MFEMKRRTIPESILLDSSNLNNKSLQSSWQIEQIGIVTINSQIRGNCPFENGDESKRVLQGDREREMVQSNASTDYSQNFKSVEQRRRREKKKTKKKTVICLLLRFVCLSHMISFEFIPMEQTQKNGKSETKKKKKKKKTENRA